MRTNCGQGAHLLDGPRAGVNHRGRAGRLTADTGSTPGCPCRARGLQYLPAPASPARWSCPEVPVGRAMLLRHGAEGAHAAVALVRSALVEFDFAGRFLGAGEQPADHHRMRTGNQRLGDVARIADAAIGDQRHATFPAAPWPHWPPRKSAAHPHRPRCAWCRWNRDRCRPFTASAPAFTSSRAASPVTMLPPITCNSGHLRLMAATTSSTQRVVTMGGIDDDHNRAGIAQLGHAVRACPGVVPTAAPTRRAAVFILAGAGGNPSPSGCPSR